jgi:hypothetical protein
MRALQLMAPPFGRLSPSTNDLGVCDLALFSKMLTQPVLVDVRWQVLDAQPRRRRMFSHAGEPMQRRMQAACLQQPLRIKQAGPDASSKQRSTCRVTSVGDEGILDALQVVNEVPAHVAT